ncbi:MAG: hypothetical protein AB1671_03810 [Thermodesulfobacteriota bacterium]|jgi:hypothetical protein
MKKKTSEAETALLKCKVSQGMFSHERGVLVELPDGRRVSALVDKNSVQVTRDPRAGEEVEGRVKVSVLETKKDSALVDLPQPGLAEGPRLRVPKGLIEKSRRDSQ